MPWWQKTACCERFSELSGLNTCGWYLGLSSLRDFCYHEKHFRPTEQASALMMLNITHLFGKISRRLVLREKNVGILSGFFGNKR